MKFQVNREFKLHSSRGGLVAVGGDVLDYEGKAFLLSDLSSRNESRLKGPIAEDITFSGSFDASLRAVTKLGKW